MDEEKLIQLEIKISHQEMAIEILQKNFYDQQLAIEKLEKSLKLLRDRFEGVSNGQGEIMTVNEKPPHY
jgi:SlyX protein